MAEESSVDKALKTAGNVARFAAENVLLPIVTGGTSLATKLPKAVKALNFLSSARPKNEEKKDDSNVFIIIGIAVFFLLPIITLTAVSTAFMDSLGLTPITVLQGTPAQITPAPLLCQNPRHQAEEIICWLREGINQTPKCPQSFDRVCIDPYLQVTGCAKDWPIISECLNASSNIPGKEIVVFEFEESINNSLKIIDKYSGKLQCVGFVKAIERSLGYSLESCGHAKDFWGTSCPVDYEKITANEAGNLKPGDLAVRTAGDYGHIGIIIKIEGNIKIVVAQAWGTTGEVFLSEDAITDYQGFLRYKY